MSILKNQVAIITGANRGIGHAIASSLAAEGMHLLLSARNMDKLNRLTSILSEQYPNQKILALACDVQNPEAVNALADRAITEFGKIEVLINNAGVAPKIGLLQECSIDDINNTIDTNLKGPIYAMKAVLPHMTSLGTGTIININSVAGKTAYPFWAIYAASKFGLFAITEAVAEEQRSNGIRVVGIHPGAVATEIWDSVDMQQAPDPRGMLQAQNVADAVLYALKQPQHVLVSDITVMPTKPAL
ncbi:MAG: SDR family oxidoreductase [Vampirovibrionales bacterium]|nr:SDR family oxidoreductase [Vampirovibrionales bacterium]